MNYQQGKEGIASSSLPGHCVPGILAQTFPLELSLEVAEGDREGQQLHLTWENCMTHSV